MIMIRVQFTDDLIYNAIDFFIAVLLVVPKLLKYYVCISVHAYTTTPSELLEPYSQ